MSENLLVPQRSPLAQKTHSPIPIGSFTEFSNYVKKYFLEDEWRIIEQIAQKAYPGTKEEFNEVCRSFFKEQFISKAITIEEAFDGDLTLWVYDFLNHAKIQRKAFRFQNEKEKSEAIEALSKLFRTVVHIIIPKLVKYFNNDSSDGYQIPIDIIEKAIEEIVIIERVDASIIQTIGIPGKVSEKDLTTSESSKKQIVAELFWDSKHDFKDLKILGDLLKEQYQCMLSPVRDLVNRLDISNRARKKIMVRWNESKLDILVVLIYKLYKDKSLPLKLTCGKGFWKAAEPLFGDFSGKSFRIDFNKHYYRVTSANTSHTIRVMKDVDDIIKSMKQQLQSVL